MKRLASLLFFVCAVASAQQSTTGRIPQENLYTGDPTGASCFTNAKVQSTTTGGIYTCVGGVYVSNSSVPAFIYDKGGAVFNVVAYGAKPDARVVSDAVANAGFPTVTSATAAFTAADTGKEFVVNAGAAGVGSATYTSGATATGAAGAICNVTFGAGGATGFLELSATNTVAASTAIMITAFGSGYSAGSQSATLSNGTATSFVNPSATCSGTVTVNVTALYYAPIVTTATYVNATTVTMAVNATSSVTSANAAIGTNNDTAITAALTALNAAGSGILQFPQGKFLSNACNFTLSTPTNVRGAGMPIINGSNHIGAGGTILYCPSNTTSFFTQTADTSNFSDIGLVNIGGKPTGGAAITATSVANGQQATIINRVDFENWFDCFDDTTTGNSRLSQSACSNYVRYGALIDNTVNVDAGGFIIDGNNFTSIAQTWVFGSSTFYQNGAGGGKIINNNSSGIANRVEHGYVGTDNLVNTVQLLIANNNWDQVGGSILVGGHMMPDVVIRNNMMISNQTVYGAMIPLTFNVLQNFEIGGGYINTLCTPSCPANDILIGTASNGTINPFANNGTTGVIANFGGTSIDNSGQNPLGFPVNQIQPYSGTTVTVAAPSLTQSNSAAGSTLTIQSTWNNSGGSGWIFSKKGSAAAAGGLVLFDGSTDDWRIAGNGDDNLHIKNDSTGHEDILCNLASDGCTFYMPPVAGGVQTVSGCSLSSAAGGSFAGQFISGTSGTCTVTITPGITAPNGFSCWANDITTPTDKLQQTVQSATAPQIAGTTATNDHITWGCVAY